MIVGLLCRHYKSYQGLNFIPICNDYENAFSLFIGNNAVGKSSILESLNTFFNNTNWNITKNTKKDEAFIAPVFLIKKDDISSISIYKSLEIISNYFWKVDENANANLKSNEEFKKFFQFRDELKFKYGEEKYLFFIMGMNFKDKTKVMYSTFDKDLKTKFSNIDVEDIKLLQGIKEYYSYVYIPVESVTSDVIRVENKEMQDLMSTDILNEIDSILNQKNISEAGCSRKTSLIDYLNTNLDNYMNRINEAIEKIDNSYAYKVEHGYKRKLTALDVRSKILEAYFSIRTLKKDKKEIHELSSGEQRIALIDVATAFLENSEDSSNRKIILAIDEPENSLHISKCYGQFERLQKLVGSNQLLLTTHWYGALPITNIGNLHHIDVTEDYKININTYDLNNYFEKRGALPEDIQMKSYFDLTSAILSSIRSEKSNWIICEGSDDKLYLKHYLNNLDNIRLLSVGGCGNVIKIYKYLYMPFLEKEEKKAIESKVLCLIDTDDIIHDLNISSEVKGKLKLARIQSERDGTLKLKSVSKAGYHYPTEIEDCLNPFKYYESIKDEMLESENEELKEIFNKYEFNECALFSRIKDEELSILKPKELVEYKDKKKILNFLDDHHNKFKIAKNYTSKEKEETPPLFKLIEAYFKES